MKTSVKWIRASLLVALVLMISCAVPLMEDHNHSQAANEGQTVSGTLVRIGTLSQAEAISARGRPSAIRCCCENEAIYAVITIRPASEEWVFLDLHLLDTTGNHVGTLTRLMHVSGQTVDLNGERLPVLSSTKSAGHHQSIEDALLFDFMDRDTSWPVGEMPGSGAGDFFGPGANNPFAPGAGDFFGPGANNPFAPGGILGGGVGIVAIMSGGGWLYGSLPGGGGYWATDGFRTGIACNETGIMTIFYPGGYKIEEHPCGTVIWTNPDDSGTIFHPDDTYEDFPAPEPPFSPIDPPDYPQHVGEGDKEEDEPVPTGLCKLLGLLGFPEIVFPEIGFPGGGFPGGGFGGF